jgi:hypothetical protein
MNRADYRCSCQCERSRPEDGDLPVAGSGQRGFSAWDGLHATAALPRAITLPHPRTGQVSCRATGEYMIDSLTY